MSRAYTLADVIGQLNNDSAEQIDLNPTEVVNEYLADSEGALSTETWALPSTPLLAPYDLIVMNDGPVAYWRLNEFGNYLTAEDSGFEGGTVGSYTGSAATIANSTLQAHSGTHSLQVTATGANSAATTGYYGTDGGKVPAAKAGGLPTSSVWCGSFWVRTAVAGLQFSINVNSYDTQGNVSSNQSLVTSPVTPSVNTWTQIFFSFSLGGNGVGVPGNAFRLQPVCTNSANTNVWFLDDVTINQVGYDSMPFSAPDPRGYTKLIASTVNGTIAQTQGPYQYPGGGGIAGPVGNGISGGGIQFRNLSSQLWCNLVGNVVPAQLNIFGNLSVEMWINPNAAMTGSVGDSHVLISDDVPFYQLSLNGDGSLTFAQNGLFPGQVVANAGSIPNTNSWHHVVIVRQGASKTIQCYVDTVLKNTITYTTVPSGTPTHVFFGLGITGYTLVGLKMAEVALYARPLTQAQIANHYQGAGYGSPPASQTVTGSGYGNSYSQTTAGWGNVPAVAYGLYGFTQYPTASASSVAAYDNGSTWGSFVWN